MKQELQTKQTELSEFKINELIEKHNEIYNKGANECVNIIGKDIFEIFFDGDEKLLESHNPRKIKSLNNYKEEISIPYSNLWFYTRVYVQDKLLPSREGSKLTFSHKRLLLAVPKDEKIKMVNEAFEEGKLISIKQFIKKIKDKYYKEIDYWKESHFTPYTHWNFSLPYWQQKHPGNIPAQIFENVFLRFTKEGDYIIDPMAGGGTAYKVGVHNKRKVKCYDLNPTNENIIKNNILSGIPEKDDSVNLVFLDPPYWQQKKGEYSNDKNDLANMPLNEFYDKIKFIAKECKRILKQNGKIAFIIGNTIKKDIKENHIDKCKNIFLDCGFNWIMDYSVIYQTQQYKGFDVNRAKETFSDLNTFRDLFIMEK